MLSYSRAQQTNRTSKTTNASRLEYNTDRRRPLRQIGVVLSKAQNISNPCTAQFQVKTHLLLTDEMTVNHSPCHDLFRTKNHVGIRIGPTKSVLYSVHKQIIIADLTNNTISTVGAY